MFWWANEVAVSFSAVAVAIIGFVGLRQWRAELRGRAEYEVARRLLRAVLSLRDAIGDYRHPLTFRGEDVGRERADGETHEEAVVQNEEFAKRNRLKEVQKAASDLEQARLEAEALWGDSVREALEPLFKCFGELFVAHEGYFEGELKRAQGHHVDSNFLGNDRIVIYGWHDDYWNELTVAVQSAQTAFRGHLK